MKLLVVEDEHKTADYVRQGLTEAGFVVDLARDGPDGLHLATTEHYDLIVLDVMLPGIDGRKVLQSIRATGNQVPVLFLTARSSVDDRVQGLELGADDYLIKPFAFSELLARVRTLLRRGGSPAPHDRIQIADLELDLARRRAIRAGHRITLTSKEFALLELLARRQGEVLPRSLIASQVRRASSYLSPLSRSNRLNVSSAHSRCDHRVAFRVEGNGPDVRPVACAA